MPWKELKELGVEAEIYRTILPSQDTDERRVPEYEWQVEQKNPVVNKTL
jgi:hypothetical protein